MKIDLSLKNAALYEGCEIKEVGGRLALITPPEEAANIVGRNMANILSDCKNREDVTLTGPMAVWAYLVVFHQVVHSFRQVWYDDGRNSPIQLAQH